MSKSTNLSAVLNDLKSDKVRERQQGIVALRAVFERDLVVLTLDESGKGQAWLSVFQALYVTVGIEKAASIKKGSQAAALRRLSDAAATVRWLTERSVKRMNKAVVKSLFTHLTQTMVYNGELLAPVALDYIKALKCLVSWMPHMDHLNGDIWERMVEMAFNVILGDPVRKTLDEEEDADEVYAPTAPGTDPGSSEFYMDDDTDGNATDNLPSTSMAANPRKRPQREPDSAGRLSPAKAKARRKTPRSVSLEQIEFTSLLTILLQSPSAPLLSPQSPYLASAVLQRLCRFLERYPADTSLHHDYILGLSATLSHLALNHKAEVENFACEAWDGLLDLWKTKNKAIKEGLVSVLKVLFPYFTTDLESSSTSHHWSDGVQRLWKLLDGEAENRWGVDKLSLDSLRLEVAANTNHGNDPSELAGFVAKTFYAGWHFDAGQALAWAVLELQSDCTEKVFRLSESIHSSPSKSDGKRVKLENPITSLLHSIQTHLSSTVRAYHLQILLFFIDRHWSILHDALQRDVINTLLQFVSFDDAIIQSWTFLCFAAIAHMDALFSPLCTVSQNVVPDRRRDASIWDPIWTHAIRRANVPGVCRAACHAACVLLSHAKLLLTSQRILVEIETLAKDLDVQGPAFPYDSVCVFLTQCLRVAGQDVRLHRMQIEEKVLSWLLDNWGVGDGSTLKGSSGGQSRMLLYMIGDVLMLLEGICGFSKRVNLIFRILMPDCPITKTMVDQNKTKVIRDFLLSGYLPPFRNSSKGVAEPVATNDSTSASQSTGNGDLAQPRGRERRISAYLLKSLESFASGFESIREANGYPTAEKARQALDLAVITLSFESSLVLNGTRSTRRAIQGACKSIALITALLPDDRWTPEEKALILLGLEPLISQETEDDEAGWEAIVPPDAGAGIKTQVLRRLISNGESRHAQRRTLRRSLQRIMLQCADVQDAFSKVMANLRDVLRVIVGQKCNDSRASYSVNDADDKDGFGPIRIQQSPETRQQTEENIAHLCIVRVCMAFLAVVPILQSTSGEPTRDKELTELVLQCDSKFHLVAPIFFRNVGQRLLNLSTTNIDQFLKKIGELLNQHNYSRSEKLQVSVTQFLDSTLHIWLQESTANSEIGTDIRALCHWISNMLKNNKIRSWKLRDYVVRFLDRYLHMDPNQSAWAQDDFDVESLPANLLPLLGADRDIRVRFRVAVINARLFSIARTVGQDALILYDTIKRSLTVDLHNYERMLTRMLSLGNIMVASSAVRRGPYWHMLEICLHSQTYHRHLEAILKGVSERLGLTSFSMLFEAYASQIAYSIRQAQSDFLRFPPHLLGYRDRKDCAEAAFRGFTPTNVLAGGSSASDMAHGKRLFLNHCKVIQKSPAEGLRICFGEIIGFQIVTWIDDNLPTDELDGLMKKRIMNVEGIGDFDDLLRQHVDGIIIAILRTLQDQDFSQEGSIVQALRASEESGKAAQVFRTLARYRRLDDFETHPPNLPNYGTATVLRSLAWFDARVPDTNSKATSYHVLHELFAELQRSPFVNEQIRLLNSISLWIAVHHDDFEEPTLLHTLIRGATSVLAQSDLARAAQSILEWAFSCYRRISQKDPCFPDILIKTCCLSHDYAIDTEDVAVAKMGSDLVRWIDNQASTLCKNPTLKGQVLKALPAWPHQPSTELTRIFEDITAESLSTVLGDHRISSNKFRMVRRLRDLAVEQQYEEDDFAKTDFWRLKECIPPTDQLQDDDINAFASLLVMNKGHIHSFWSDQSSTQSVRARHIRGVKKKLANTGPNITAPQHAIVVSLLTMLDSNTTRQVHVAYNTLRSLMSVLASDIPHWHSWPPEYREELQFLQTYPRTPGTRQPRDMSELTTSESFQDASKGFPEWIAMITTLLSDILAKTDVFYAQLIPILQSDVVFGEQLLPVLVHTVLQADISDNKTTKTVVSYRHLLSNYFTSLLISDTVNNSCIRSIVDIILHLRHFRCPNSGDMLSHDKWLDVDFTLLARNAITCGAYTTALLFLELATEYRGPSVADDVTAEQIMFDIYSHIDEPDGFYGIKTKDLSQFLIKRFYHEKQWEKAFRFHGAALEAGGATSVDAEGLIQAFHSFGFNRLAIDTLQCSGFEADPTSRVSGMNYQSGWRTETWDLPDQAQPTNLDTNLYLALRAIHRERDPLTIDSIIRQSFAREMGRLSVLGPENLAEIREVNRNLMCISQATQWRCPSIQNRLKRRQVDATEWTEFIQIEPGFEFSDLENIMATRISLVRAARQKEERDQIGTLVSPFAQSLKDVEKKCLVRLSEAARAADRVQIALNSIVRSQKLETSPTFDVSQEFASVLWLQREQKLAVQFLKEILNTKTQSSESDHIDPIKKAQLLAQLGTWTSEACLEKPTDILTHFFDPATTLVASLDPIKAQDPTCATVYHQYAIFAEHQYRANLKSPDAIRWKLYVERKVQEIKYRQEQIMKAGPSERKDLTQDQQKAQVLLQEDQAAYQRHNGARDAFLSQSIDMYARCLETSDAFDDDGPIRLCSLWFSNFDNADIQDKVQVALNRVQSRKFVFLAHQLSARLSRTPSQQPSKNQENLQRLMIRMCKEHPFHSLYQVYCLLPERSPSASSTTTTRHSSRHSLASQSERGAAASEIFDRLRNDTTNGERVRDLERLCEASLQWAQFPIKVKYKDRKGPFKVPDHLLISKIQKLRVPVVTFHTPVDHTLRYDNCVWVESYDEMFDTAGGVNLPKIIVCHGSDGEKYKQLFKGEGADDLRQDAVMEQVFELVNIVLRRDRETRRRSLCVRGYKVIPLASQAGVLEFVGNTSPLQGWLHNAHLKYRPNDIRPSEAHSKLKTLRDAKGSAEAMLALFHDIRTRFKPVMRHYFTERHKNPISWFAMRLNYTRSVATTSIVGHILGLGDRHVSNILMDNGTGDVVHIDLGIAFDQGKYLPVPERVPFRMTADMVDGMGISGTQGVFQRCAEETLRVLRDGSEVIMTILEVFKYDPLHSWTVSELKLKRVQDPPPESTINDTAYFGIGIDMTSGTADEAADRALSSVARKLDKALSVEYTVNELIAEATDPLNLANIFHGWSPYY